MTSMSLKQMETACKKEHDTLQATIDKISATLDESDSSKAKIVDDLRELSGKIKVFQNGKLKQLDELIFKLRQIEEGKKPQTQPPLYINDVQGYYDLTMIEARNIEQKIKELIPTVLPKADGKCHCSKA
uniref:Uncharacterized protein n=2 Tax=Rhodnius prolixus TaxID=13249 RepID=A0A4P6D9X5_RHOPR